jgi:hypothetical protein
MSKLTITEGLAEIKTIGKRVQKKREFILSHLMRQEQLKDPLAASGGTEAAIKAELQAVDDLEERRVDIRRAIQAANAATNLTVGLGNMSIADWLIWRREVAPGLGVFYNQLRNHIDRVRSEAQRKGYMTVGADAAARPGDIIVHVDEQLLATQIDNLEETLGTLDGALSLKNATTFIEV